VGADSRTFLNSPVSNQVGFCHIELDPTHVIGCAMRIFAETWYSILYPLLQTRVDRTGQIFISKWVRGRVCGVVPGPSVALPTVGWQEPICGVGRCLIDSL